MEKISKIYVAGHMGLFGSALVRALKSLGYDNIVGRTHGELELTDQSVVKDFFESEKPDYVFLAAAKVGGIMANNTYPADFIYSNLQVQNNVIHEAYKSGAKKLLFLGSSCIYPRLCDQPIKEDYLLTSKLEPTNEPYAIAKIAGIKMCQSYNRQYGTNFIAVMPTNLYGENDNFNLQTAHVLPALMRRFHEAKLGNHDKVAVWGTGAARREFMHVDDAAQACVHVMNNFSPTKEDSLQGNIFLNVGVGQDVSIREAAELIKEIVGFQGLIDWDTSKPDGMPRKLLDVNRLTSLGWSESRPIEIGLEQTYKWFVDHYDQIRQ